MVKLINAIKNLSDAREIFYHVFRLLKSRHSILIIRTPFAHSVENRSRRFTERRQRINYARRDFGEYFPFDRPVVFQSPQIVGQNFFTDCGDRFYESLNRCSPLYSELRMISNFHLLPIGCTVVATGHSGNSSLVSIVYTSFCAFKHYNIYSFIKSIVQKRNQVINILSDNKKVTYLLTVLIFAIMTVQIQIRRFIMDNYSKIGIA